MTVKKLEFPNIHSVWVYVVHTSFPTNIILIQNEETEKDYNLTFAEFTSNFKSTLIHAIQRDIKFSSKLARRWDMYSTNYSDC